MIKNQTYKFVIKYYQNLIRYSLKKTKVLVNYLMKELIYYKIFNSNIANYFVQKIKLTLNSLLRKIVFHYLSYTYLKTYQTIMLLRIVLKSNTLY